jgi:putative spermidine/putrescine transport system permease protein
MKRNSLWSWIVLVLAVLYFALPLIGTFEFSLKMRRGVYSLEAYRVVLGDPRFQSTFLYSVTMALCTIALGIVIVVTGIANGIYIWLRIRSERWLK